MKLSVFLPTIRTHLLPEFCEFLRASYSGELEVVLAGPFCPLGSPEELGSEYHYVEYVYPLAETEEELEEIEYERLNYRFITNPKYKDRIQVKWTQTFQAPTCAAQQAALACTGDLILHSVDDTLYLPNALDELVESFRIMEASLGDRIVYNAPYCDSPEGYQSLKKEKFVDPGRWSHPPTYWTAANAGYVPLNTIDNDWMTTCHFLMKKELFLEYGGFDCQFEYLNHACHDLLYRMYHDGVDGFNWLDTVSLADWVPDRQGDHGPINDAQLYGDHPKFFNKWQNVSQLKIDQNNYKNYPQVWERRFNKGGQKTYKELGYV